MGCASAKHVSTVQNEEETQKGKNYQNGDVFGDEYRIKPVEEVKYMKNGGEDDQKIAARNQENLEKSASSNSRLKSNKEIPGLVHQPRANMHISESQQEFFRMLDEKIEKVRHSNVSIQCPSGCMGRTVPCLLQLSVSSMVWRGLAQDFPSSSLVR
uniref:Proliferation-inducing protein 13 n=1 Tax=Junco hyemalis TaxID=40217 RepID=A0A8C5JJT5_JUNHY